MGLGLILLIHCPVFASDLHDIRRDVEAYLSAVRLTRTLKQHYYFNGEGGEQELEFELAACAKAGHEPLSDVCIDYNRCRYESRDTSISYYLTSLSGIVPAGSVGAITVEKGAEGTVPHVMVSAEVGGHQLLFYRSTRESEFRVFGRLVMSKIDGRKDIDVSAIPFPVSVFESDPCRSILTGE